MKTYVVTSSYGDEYRYEAEDLAGALRQYTAANPGVGVLGIMTAEELDTQESLG